MKSFWLVLLLGAWCVGATAQVVTHTIVVTTALDVTGAADACSLREAFANVNAGMAVGSNSCSAPASKPGTATRIELGLLAVPVAVISPVIHLDGQAVLHDGAVDGSDTTALFHVGGAETQLFLQDVTLQHGNSKADSGGALRVSDGASVIARNSILRDNQAALTGGAIHFEGGGLLVLDHVVAIDNAAGSGGAVYAADAQQVYVTHSRVSRNVAVHDGGALYLASASEGYLADSRFEENSAGESGGAVASAGPLGIDRVNFEANTVTQSNDTGGGALYLVPGAGKSSTQITDSRFHANRASGQRGDGGAIMSQQGLAIENTTFSSNHARGSGGALWEWATPGLAVQNSTFIDNRTEHHGSAMAVALPTLPWQPDLAQPLGGSFGMRLLNNTVADNHGAAQIHIEGKSAPGLVPLLFLGNIVDSETWRGCSGALPRLMTRRPNDNAPLSPNLQRPAAYCGGNILTQPQSLHAPAQGGYFDQTHRKTLAPDAGDAIACQVIGQVDQFGSPRACRRGAVEQAPPPVLSPQVPPIPQN